MTSVALLLHGAVTQATGRSESSFLYMLEMLLSQCLSC